MIRSSARTCQASAFKPFTAIAGLEAGVLTPRTEKVCTGTFEFASTELRCAAVHGRETTSQAISTFVQFVFLRRGRGMDHGRTLEVARRFGFGERTGIELPDETGVVPDRARYEQIKRDGASTVPLLDAIGHGEITVTLLQFARAYAAIANGGKLVHVSVTRKRKRRANDRDPTTGSCASPPSVDGRRRERGRLGARDRDRRISLRRKNRHGGSSAAERRNSE